MAYQERRSVMGWASGARWAVLAIGLAGAIGTSGCSAPPSLAAAGPGLRVVATTTLLASLAGEVGHGRAAVASLLPVGASPETYQPSPRDVARLHDAAVLIENGAGLETWLANTLASANAPNLRDVRCADGLPVIGANPHLWLDPTYARAYVAKIRDAFVAADPDGASVYRINAAALDARIAGLAARIATKIATIPPEQRGMIVFHNAWLYYNRRFGLTTLGVIEENPGAEPSAAHLARLVDIARASKTKALFAEPEYNPKLLQAVARSAKIARIAVLYDDSVAADGRANDYVSMLELDTDTIVGALR